jgi:divalent metal cation (Fe/Co/Zn/Cd) transporter
MILNTFCVDLVYNKIPTGDAIIFLFVALGVVITYVFRKLPIFNVIWGFLVAVFIYALVVFLGKKIKSWFVD